MQAGYFKVVPPESNLFVRAAPLLGVFPFADDRVSIADAHQKATRFQCEQGGRVVASHAPRQRGPWDGCPLVGEGIGVFS